MTQRWPFGRANRSTEVAAPPQPAAVPSTQAVLARALARSHKRSTRIARWRTARRWGMYHAWRHVLPVAMAVFVPASSWWPLETLTQTQTQVSSQVKAPSASQVVAAASTASASVALAPPAKEAQSPASPTSATLVPAPAAALTPAASDEPPLKLKSSSFGSAAIRAASSPLAVSNPPPIASPQLVADQSLHSQEP